MVVTREFAFGEGFNNSNINISFCKTRKKKQRGGRKEWKLISWARGRWEMVSLKQEGGGLN